MRASCGGTFLPPRKRGSARATPATQRQRVMNIGASSIAWISTCRTLAELQVARHLAELEAVRGGERQHDVVLGRRRLQLEVELAAEALAQRQPPGAVDAAAIGRVDHQLHAAGLVEEAFEHDRVLRRQAAERRMAGAQVLDELLGRRLGRRPPRRRASRSTRFPVGSSVRRSADRGRAAATRTAESSSLRPGASPSQNGMVGGAPSASSTRTVPRSTRRMR